VAAPGKGDIFHKDKLDLRPGQKNFNVIEIIVWKLFA
jgi:hypothetical protein